ncbi:MAG: type II toxin-antitoxin system RelE/ParE family toxin [Betaproteobacteria bacterium]
MNSLKSTNKRLEWAATAVKDRKAIWDFIALEEFSPFNAALVEARILQTADRLSHFPLSGKPFLSGLRLAFVTKTQFTIVYRVLPSSVRILRIAHQKKKSPVS